MSDSGASALPPRLLAEIFARFPNGAFVLDGERRFVACNDLCLAMFGMASDSLAPGVPFHDVLRGIVSRGVIDVGEATSAEAWIAAAHERVSEGRELVVRLAGGRELRVEAARLAEGALLVTLTDVSTLLGHERALESRVEELERMQERIGTQSRQMRELAERLEMLRSEAERANRTKSEFLANMSHELRSPLNAIIGFAEIMKDELFGSLGSAQYREYALDIWSSGRHLLDVINDILDLSKIEAGKAELAETRFDLAATVATCLRLVAGRAQQADVSVRSTVASEGISLMGDERKTKQILINLLTNAIKFTKPGGRVRVEILDDGRQLDVRISDTGIGMSPEEIPIALAAFGQVDSSLARKHEGTGLGLPLSKALVEMHGGQLLIESEVGIGTTVTVRLPPERVIRRSPSAAA